MATIRPLTYRTQACGQHKIAPQTPRNILTQLLGHLSTLVLQRTRMRVWNRTNAGNLQKEQQTSRRRQGSKPAKQTSERLENGVTFRWTNFEGEWLLLRTTERPRRVQPWSFSKAFDEINQISRNLMLICALVVEAITASCPAGTQTSTRPTNWRGGYYAVYY